MELADAWLNWIWAHRVALIELAGFLGLLTSAYLAKARGQALDAVINGVASAGVKSVMTVIKEEFHDELVGLPRYILSERANKAKKRQGIIKKLKGEK